VPMKERRAIASAMVKDRPEFIARAKSSRVVQDELRRLYAKEALALLRKLAKRCSKNDRSLNNSVSIGA
jgi:hypothetical protein